MRSLEVERFSLTDSLECGQTFCWSREGDGYVNADIGQVVYVEQRENSLYYDCSQDDVDLRKMFRLDDPLDDIQQEISIDGFMKASIEFAPDLRIVRDPFYPALVAFLCSVWKNVPAIRGLTISIRRAWGPSYDFRGKTYYGMPTPEQMSRASVKDLKKLGLAWRADFISRSTESILEGLVSETELQSTDYLGAHRMLRKLHGVGNKVADCVCLFSLGFLEAFPIDVWIERVIQEHYDVFSQAGKSYARRSDAARKYFGKYAGYAQEYLYNYSRSVDKG